MLAKMSFAAAGAAATAGLDVAIISQMAVANVHAGIGDLAAATWLSAAADQAGEFKDWSSLFDDVHEVSKDDDPYDDNGKLVRDPGDYGDGANSPASSPSNPQQSSPAPPTDSTVPQSSANTINSVASTIQSSAGISQSTSAASSQSGAVVSTVSATGPVDQTVPGETQAPATTGAIMPTANTGGGGPPPLPLPNPNPGDSGQGSASGTSSASPPATGPSTTGDSPVVVPTGVPLSPTTPPPSQRSPPPSPFDGASGDPIGAAGPNPVSFGGVGENLSNLPTPSSADETPSSGGDTQQASSRQSGLAPLTIGFGPPSTTRPTPAPGGGNPPSGGDTQLSSRLAPLSIGFGPVPTTLSDLTDSPAPAAVAVSQPDDGSPTPAVDSGAAGDLQPEKSQGFGQPTASEPAPAPTASSNKGLSAMNTLNPLNTPFNGAAAPTKTGAMVAAPEKAVVTSAAREDASPISDGGVTALAPTVTPGSKGQCNRRRRKRHGDQ